MMMMIRVSQCMGGWFRVVSREMVKTIYYVKQIYILSPV